MSKDTRNHQPELSHRQQQILKLLQAGKVNKAVAEELGIGLGTVKQHIVAIFKKLKVSNRAMAAVHGMEIIPIRQNSATELPKTSLLESRPCVVLSLALPPDAAQRSAKLMYGSLAAIASANDAVFLARNGNAGDLIFGIQRATEYDLAVALQAVRTVYDDILEMDGETAQGLRGCMTAGVALASMQRFGGWTGEAIASTAIASARELLNCVTAGQFIFDASALDLIELFGISRSDELMPAMSLAELKNVRWTGERRTYQLVGRDHELSRLDVALADAAKGNGRLILLKGEMGMGKSSLCEAIAQTCLKRKGVVSYFRCLPSVLSLELYDTSRKTVCSVDEVLASLSAEPERYPELVVVDDLNLLPKKQRTAIIAAGAAAVENGKLVIFSGRKGLLENISTPAETIRLGRLPAQSIQTLVRNAMGKGTVKERAQTVQRISSVAAGVPLFATELARHHEESFTLLLRVAINARLDSLHLDRNLLREVARNRVCASIEEIAERLGEDIETLRPQMERAIASGVLLCREGEWLSFTHPLLRMAIGNSVVEPA